MSISVKTEEFSKRVGLPVEDGARGKWVFESPDGKWGFKKYGKYGEVVELAKKDYSREMKTSTGTIEVVSAGGKFKSEMKNVPVNKKGAFQIWYNNKLLDGKVDKKDLDYRTSELAGKTGIPPREMTTKWIEESASKAKVVLDKLDQIDEGRRAGAAGIYVVNKNIQAVVSGPWDSTSRAYEEREDYDDKRNLVVAQKTPDGYWYKLSRTGDQLSELDFRVLESKSFSGVNLKKATGADKAKGESYGVIDISTSKIVVSDDGKTALRDLKRSSAKELAKTDKNYKVVSMTFAQDKGMLS